MKKLAVILGLVVLVLVAAAISRDTWYPWLFRPTESAVPQGITAENDSVDLTVAANNLETPWDIERLPDGDLLVTERGGILQRIGKDMQTYEVSGVEQVVEGGLLGIALDPEFASNKRLYVYMTTRGSDGNLTNRVERYTYASGGLSGRQIVIEGIPGASTHDGGALGFSPDGYLYITTGDAANEQSAQDTSVLSGKILRLNADGSIPADNPYKNAVYSYGHRNPQGIAWDGEGRLWATEHGRSGRVSGYDELNRIEKGKNYGWPVIEGDETREGMETPVAHSGANDTWAPASLAYADGSLYFGGLRGQGLYQARIVDEGQVSIVKHFSGEYGRLRALYATSDGLTLYMGTSNRDGRGEPVAADDRLFRLPVSLFDNN